MDSLSTVMETVWHAEVADPETKIVKLLIVFDAILGCSEIRLFLVAAIRLPGGSGALPV
jgi:hypothetical protein